MFEAKGEGNNGEFDEIVGAYLDASYLRPEPDSNAVYGEQYEITAPGTGEFEESELTPLQPVSIADLTPQPDDISEAEQLLAGEAFSVLVEEIFLANIGTTPPEENPPAPWPEFTESRLVLRAPIAGEHTPWEVSIYKRTVLDKIDEPGPVANRTSVYLRDPNYSRRGVSYAQNQDGTVGCLGRELVPLHKQLLTGAKETLRGFDTMEAEQQETALAELVKKVQDSLIKSAQESSNDESRRKPIGMREVENLRRLLLRPDITVEQGNV